VAEVLLVTKIEDLGRLRGELLSTAAVGLGHRRVVPIACRVIGQPLRQAIAVGLQESRFPRPAAESFAHVVSGDAAHPGAEVPLSVQNVQ
jgi:hypothetical protein